MKTTKTITVDKEIIEYTCDECGKTSGDWNRICMICGREICKNCCNGIDIYETNLMNRPYYGGDHPLERICEKCWAEGFLYRANIQHLRNEAERQEEKLLYDWKKDARNGRINSNPR